jgi:hypothetical protein
MPERSADDADWGIQIGRRRDRVHDQGEYTNLHFFFALVRLLPRLAYCSDSGADVADL